MRILDIYAELVDEKGNLNINLDKWYPQIDKELAERNNEK
jgi:hypothetical protein